MSRDLRINEQIRVREVRLIDEEGEQLGVLSTMEALKVARERGVDLVEVAPTAVPPVCRLLDYGRFKYEQEKKDREARKNQKTVLMKEIRLRPKTDEHDLAFKAKQIERFVEEGDKVKVTLRFRGREMVHPGVGRALLEDLAQRVKETVAVERMPLMEAANTMTMIMVKGKVAGAPAAPGEVPAAAPRPAPADRPAPVQRPVAPTAAAAPTPPTEPAASPPPPPSTATQPPQPE